LEIITTLRDDAGSGIAQAGSQRKEEKLEVLTRYILLTSIFLMQRIHHARIQIMFNRRTYAGKLNTLGRKPKLHIFTNPREAENKPQLESICLK
jgi:hypothetical protein